jgi:hypothetical protein
VIDLQKFLLGCLICFNANGIYGQASNQEPDAKEWFEQVNAENLEALKIPLKLLVLESNQDSNLGESSVKAPEYNNDICRDVSFVKCINGSDFNFALKINNFPETYKAKDFARFSGASVVLFSDQYGLHLIDSLIGETIDSGRKFAFKKSMDVRKLLDVFLASLGYDGVVLDVKGEYILVGTLDIKMRRNVVKVQTIKNSADSILLDQKLDQEVHDSEMALVNHYSGYAVFKNTSTGIVPKIGQKLRFVSRN